MDDIDVNDLLNQTRIPVNKEELKQHILDQINESI